MDLTQGGIRVPWIAHRPALIEPASVSAQRCMTMDGIAALLDAASVDPDPAWPLNGASLPPVRRDPSHLFRRPIHWRMNHRDQRTLRDGNGKYLRVDGND